jgi:hypothetical protein
MIPQKRIPQKIQQAVASQCNSRLQAERTYRLSFWTHWAALAEMLLPRRYKWFITPNQLNRGSPINGAIVDETGVVAARTCASGMLSGLTSPTKPWFRLGLSGFQDVPPGNAKMWLAEVERRMLRVFSGSNFYQALGVLYHDVVVFGSAALIEYEDPHSVVRFFNPCLGEFFFISSARIDINGLYREYTLTVQQAVEQFGFENMSENVQILYKGGGAGMAVEVVICHAIEPNLEVRLDGTTSLGYIVPKHFRFREIYWEQAGAGSTCIMAAGYHEKCFFGARWDVTSNDAYGRSPGMDALPALRQLQVEQRRKGEAIDKIVRPPMTASVNMKNEPASILPGSITYVADMSQSGFKPAYQINPNLADMKEDISEIQNRIKSVFYSDLFMMISQLDTVRTATEINERREEKLIQLGPVIERFENEVLDPIINRTFAIMQRRGLIPPPPPEIKGLGINVQYVSMLAEQQRASSTTAIERLVAFIGNVMAAIPDAGDNLDYDETIDEYADLLDTPAKLLRDPKAVAAIRAQRAQQQQAAATAQASMAAAQGAQTLSKTEVGGGKNALESMLNG